MFQRARKHLNPGTLIALLALIFTATGGAFAATGGSGGRDGNGGSNTHPLSASAAKSKGKTGPRGPRGPAGPAGKNGANGTPGAQGPAGAKGENGAAGAAGATGPQGPEGKSGKEGKEGEEGTPGTEGSPWTAGGTLPSGSTETGTFSARFEGTEASHAVSPISFPIQLAAELGTSAVHYVTLAKQEAKEVPAECKAMLAGVETEGSAARPLAAKGNLCLFQGRTIEPENTIHLRVSTTYAPEPSEPGNPGGTVEGAGRTGALVLIQYSGPAETAELTGSWAVTAP